MPLLIHGWYTDSIKLPFHKNLALYLIQCYQMSNVGGVKKKKNLTEPVSLQTKTDTLSNQQNYQIWILYTIVHSMLMRLVVTIVYCTQINLYIHLKKINKSWIVKF